MWRLFDYTTYKEKLAVIFLPYHPEGRHRVSFAAYLTTKQISEIVESQNLIFLDWIAYNVVNANDRDLLYSECPLFFTYMKKKGWHARRKDRTIGRMPVAVPRQGEHFNLRTLLTIKSGARLYQDIFTVNGNLYESSSATGRALGLVFDDTEWILLFNEVKVSAR